MKSVFEVACLPQSKGNANLMLHAWVSRNTRIYAKYSAFKVFLSVGSGAADGLGALGARPALVGCEYAARLDIARRLHSIFTVFHDSAFVVETAQLAQLVARGDVAAFEIDGQVDVTPLGQARFTHTLVVLAHAAFAHKRRATVRWRFDPVGSAAAARRTASNLSLLIAAVHAAYAQIQSNGARATALIEIVFASMGPQPPHIASALGQLGVVFDMVGGCAPAEPAAEGSLLMAWDTTDPTHKALCKYEVGASGAKLVHREYVQGAHELVKREHAARSKLREGVAAQGFIWAFDATGEIWTPTACLASGPLAAWRVGRTVFNMAGGCRAVVSFCDDNDFGHRGVRIRQPSGREYVVAEEFDTSAKLDPTYNRDNATIDAAWASDLGKALATWLSVVHEDQVP